MSLNYEYLQIFKNLAKDKQFRSGSFHLKKSENKLYQNILPFELGESILVGIKNHKFICRT